METIVVLIRENPFGSFIVIMALLSGVFSLARSFINRNKPVCNCDCCEVEGDDDEEDEDES